eukprot:11229138-Alexandrium_andersonii.AAC.1
MLLDMCMIDETAGVQNTHGWCMCVHLRGCIAEVAQRVDLVWYVEVRERICLTLLPADACVG